MYSFLAFLILSITYTAKVAVLQLFQVYESIVTMQSILTAIGWTISFVAGLITIWDKFKKKREL